MTRTTIRRPRPGRLRDERGSALVVALLSLLLLTALGLALTLTTTTETAIAANQRMGQEVMNAADSAIERAMQDLLAVPDWNRVLSGADQSSFVDGSPGGESIQAVSRGGVVLLRAPAGRARHLAAAEHEQLPGQGGGPARYHLLNWGCHRRPVCPGAGLDSPPRCSLQYSQTRHRSLAKSRARETLGQRAFRLRGTSRPQEPFLLPKGITVDITRQKTGVAWLSVASNSTLVALKLVVGPDVAAAAARQVRDLA